ncbi:hypothetical protein ACFE04_031199 [Oxalis oulophora]
MRGSSLIPNRRAMQKFRQLATTTVGSMKLKLLLICVVAFTLIALVNRASISNQTSLSSIDLVSGGTTSLKGYAIVMNTWKRYDLLKQSISHYSSCRGLDSIHVVWSEPTPPPVPLKEFLYRIVQENSRDRQAVKLEFDIHTENSLNNRFKEISGLETDAVFSIDDDVIFPCSTVEFAFSVWRSAPDAMVGFVPRTHWVDESKGNTDRYVYAGWWSVWWSGAYSMILSKAAFFHKKYLTLYSKNMPQAIKDYITTSRNCEDIAMSFLVANATNAPPIWVKGEINEIGSTGISSLGGHVEKRSKCINKFAAEFGKLPLVRTSMKAIDSRNTWFW